MENVVTNFFQVLLEESGLFLLMFLVAGVILNLLGEMIKLSRYPKLTADEKAKGKEEKECPRTFGLMLGFIWTAVWVASALTSSYLGAEHCVIIGGLGWLFIWIVAFYLYQFVAFKLAKKLVCFLFPKWSGKETVVKEKKDKDKKVKKEYVTKEELLAMLGK